LVICRGAGACLPVKGGHILQAGEVQKDLGLEAIVEAAQDLALDDSEDEENGDLTVIANPSSGDESATHDTYTHQR